MAKTTAVSPQLSLSLAPQRMSHTPASSSCGALWLSLFFPQLALEAVCLAGMPRQSPGRQSLLKSAVVNDDLPVVVIEEVAGRHIVHTVSAAAMEAGIEPGMTAAAAYALCPALVTKMRDQIAERECLQRLAEWAGQFTSMVSLEPPQALLLEIGGSLRLFEGLSNLQKRVRQTLQYQPHRFNVAVAPTPQGAFLLSAHGSDIAITEKKALRAELGKLPLSSLPLEARLIERLAKTGLRTLHDLWRLPHDALTRRFGPGLTRYLDRLLGRQFEPRQAHPVPARFHAEQWLPTGVDNAALILEVVAVLVQQLGHFLRVRDAGTTELRLVMFHNRTSPSALTVGSRHISRDKAHWMALITERFNQLYLAEPAIALSLSTEVLHAFTPEHGILFSPRELSAKVDQDWQALLAHLEVRLGRHALHGLQTVADHRPEKAWRDAQYGIQSGLNTMLRPLWLLSRPELLPVKAGQPYRQGALRLLSEPERIESGWWDGGDVRRDYYIAADHIGSRLWIFRDLRYRNKWFLHGLFG